MRGAKSGFSNSRNQKCGQVTFFGVDIHVIITYIYIYISYIYIVDIYMKVSVSFVRNR
jgi:hypothetical protein